MNLLLTIVTLGIYRSQGYAVLPPGPKSSVTFCDAEVEERELGRVFRNRVRLGCWSTNSGSWPIRARVRPEASISGDRQPDPHLLRALGPGMIGGQGDLDRGSCVEFFPSS